MTCWKKLIILFCLSINFSLIHSKKTSDSESGEFVVTEITKGNHKRILSQNKYVFIKFYTEWCVYCKKIYDIWELVGEHFADSPDVLIADMDCDKYKPTCRKFNVREYPMLIMFRDGKRFERYVGPQTSHDIINYVKRFLEKRKLKDGA